MVGFSAALKKVKKLIPDVSWCTEMTDAYIFGTEESKYAFGGEVCVILKKDGRAIGQTYYYDEVATEDSKIIREKDLSKIEKEL